MKSISYPVTLCCPSTLGLLGVCAYLVGFTLPFRWDIPLIVLVLATVLATGFTDLEKAPINRRLFFSMLAYLAATGFSMLLSEDLARSTRLSISFLPGLLLFFLITHHIRRTTHIRFLYLTISALGLGLSALILLTALKTGAAGPVGWIGHLNLPIFVVPNDVTFLAVLAPFSLALLCLKFRGVSGFLALFSLVLSISVVCLFQSRVAALTLFVGLAGVALFLRPRIGLVCCLFFLALLLVMDGFHGFPLLSKFGRLQDQRIVYWMAGLSMFLDAPLLGHGPKTFGPLYLPYRNNLDLPDWFFIDDRIAPWAHNLYVELLAEQGLVGFLTFVLMLIIGLFMTLKMNRTRAVENRILAVGVFGSLLSFCFASMLELSFLRHWVVIVFFMILGIIAQLSFIQTEERR